MNQAKATTLYRIALFFMILLLLLGFSCCAWMVYELFYKPTIQNTPLQWYLLSGIIIFFLSGFLVGKLYWKYKDIATYDEFGVRTKEKRRMKMDSKERRELELQSLAELERVLPRNTIEKLTKSGSTNAEKDLADLIGITNVKERLLEMQARMEFEETNQKKRKKSDLTEGHHMVFFGNPGTGKTTVARILTNLLYEYEYLEKNQFLEVDGNFLKSEDASMTETKIRYLCRAAKGKLLFIDEAYSLGEDEIGRIAIATLIKEMEDHRSEFVVILAGYPEQMTTLLESNPGFQSRIKEYFHFPDYSQDELLRIFYLMAKEKGFSVHKDCDIPLGFRFCKERLLGSWGNARTVRNVLEESIDKHAAHFINGQLPPSQKYCLQAMDISSHPKSSF